MKRIGLTVRVYEVKDYVERRDCYDQRWISLLESAGYIPIIIPNKIDNIELFIDELGVDGVVLTGGNNLMDYGGDSPERDLLEKQLVKICISKNIPVLGVCRGMQLLNNYYGGSLKKLSGHVSVIHKIIWQGTNYNTNSYHNFGIDICPKEFKITGINESDNTIEAFESRELKLYGIMWHPERNEILSSRDINFLKEIFND